MVFFKLKQIFPIATVALIATPLFGENPDSSSFIPEKIALGQDHTCALSSAGQIKCWGDNDYGQLGTGDKESAGHIANTMGHYLRTVDIGTNVLAKDICAGGEFSCAMTTKGAVKCWGYNYYGQLGQERDNGYIGAAPNQMGDALPWTDLGDDFVATQVQCGGNFACALSSTGKVKCWGRNQASELGLPAQPVDRIGKKKGDMGNQLPYLPLPGPVTHLSVAGETVCAAAEQKIYCWGSNFWGGVGTEQKEKTVALSKDGVPNLVDAKLEAPEVKIGIDLLTTGFSHSCAMYHVVSESPQDSKQKIKCWGLNGFGQWGAGSRIHDAGLTKDSMGTHLPETITGATDITHFGAYEDHSCIRTKRGLVKCWGYNEEGQLGQGDRKARGRDPDEMGENLAPINLGLPALSINTGGSMSSHACAILINHGVKCWGENQRETLGYEDKVTRGTAPNDMGDNLPYVRLD